MNRSVDLEEADPRSYVRLAAHTRKQIMSGDLVSGHPVPSITTLSQELGHFVGGHPELPAGGHEEDPMAITERDCIR